jgi:hypothetical protein
VAAPFGTANAAATGEASGAADWIEGEARIVPALRSTFARLAVRARRSWFVWLPAAFVLASLLTLRRARQGDVYESRVVLRAIEGAVSGEGRAAVQLGDLRDDVSVLAFTEERLAGVMRKHIEAFPDIVDDPSGATKTFREAMDVVFEENDFVEDRAPGDPARSILIAVSFEAAKPDLAYAIVHELADLLVSSGQEGQKRLQQRRQAAAAEVVKGAEAELDALTRAAAGAYDRRISIARDRLRAAQEGAAGAALAVSGSVSQVLRFDVVDAGRPPPPLDLREELTWFFALASLVCVVAAWLAAGAFDPRVLDALDLAALGATVLGHVPALPGGRDDAPHAGGQGAPPRPRV